MQDKPHRPEPLTSHDPYPRPPDEGPDPMRERRRNSRKFYDGVNAAIAARPPQPSYITRSEGTDEEGYVITHDDGLGTVIKVERVREEGDAVGKVVLEVTSLGDTVRVDLGGSLDHTLYHVLRRVIGIDRHIAPITGSR